MKITPDVKTCCRHFGKSRAAYYKKHTIHKEDCCRTAILRTLIGDIRNDHPRMGVKKLYMMLRKYLNAYHICISRDKLFDFMREQHLLVEPRRKKPQTTHFDPALPTVRNLFADRILHGPNEAWVADVTYINIKHKWFYLALITDAYSRKIVGYSLSSKNDKENCIQALRMAAAQLPKGAGVLHHSDRGCQYASRLYRNELARLGLTQSMTEVFHCYENSKAERVNGILKDEYYLDGLFSSEQEALRTIRHVISLYNTKRPHYSLKMATPEDVHSGKVPPAA